MTAPTTPTRTLTARTPEDLLALVPVVLGFVPHDSVVMLTFGGAQQFHARVDLPGVATDLPEMVDALLRPARLHGVRQVVFIVYCDSAPHARRAARCLVQTFGSRGLEILELLRADGGRWWPALGTRSGVPPWGVPYDLSSHRFSADAVLDGRVLHRSREELRATLTTDPVLTAPVVAALARGAGGGDGPPDPDWAAALVEQHSRDGTVPGTDDLARLLGGMLDPEVRDAACAGLGRGTARDHLRLWTEVVRRCPGPLLAAPAALLALAAWQVGEGALAWCALDRCTEADEDYPLAVLLAQALVEAVPPDAWEAEC